MTFKEITEQIEHLSTDEQRALLRILRELIGETSQGSEQPTDSEMDEDDVDPNELFREGWADAMEGRTHPISFLWDDIDDE